MNAASLNESTAVSIKIKLVGVPDEGVPRMQRVCPVPTHAAATTIASSPTTSTSFEKAKVEKVVF